MEHQRAESLLLPKLQQIRCKEDYVMILQMFYGFFAPLQEHIFSLLSLHDLPDLSQRRHASLIVQDLKQLDVDDALQTCKDVPMLRNRAEALGALYVLEGSTLGGRMIKKMLLKHDTVKLHEAQLQFFHGYGDHTGSMWTSFVDVLNKQPDAEAMIDAAKNTFNTFSDWIQSSLYHHGI
jgi:heme oxygenase